MKKARKEGGNEAAVHALAKVFHKLAADLPGMPDSNLPRSNRQTHSHNQDTARRVTPATQTQTDVGC